MQWLCFFKENILYSIFFMFRNCFDLFGLNFRNVRLKSVFFVNCVIFYTPPHFSVGVLCYTFRCLSVRPSVRAHHFRSITWVFIHGIFSNFAYILLSAMSGTGLLMGKIRPFLTELLPFFVLEKWFLACNTFAVHDIWMKLHRYVAHQRLHIVTKDHHSDLPSLWVICPW